MKTQTVTDTGGRLVIGNFTPQKGRRLSGIIDRKGRVYKPHPYDVPQEPMKVLAFALNHVLMMMDTNRIKVFPKGRSRERALPRAHAIPPA